jgi:hypothetical protein
MLYFSGELNYCISFLMSRPDSLVDVMATYPAALNITLEICKLNKELGIFFCCNKDLEIVVNCGILLGAYNEIELIKAIGSGRGNLVFNWSLNHYLI